MFYDNLCSLLDNNGMNISQLAKEIGINQSSASDWKRGAVPRIGTMRKIAEYFGITIEELKADKKEPVSEDSLTDDEMALLKAFRSADGEEKEMILKLVAVVSKRNE